MTAKEDSRGYDEVGDFNVSHSFKKGFKLPGAADVSIKVAKVHVSPREDAVPFGSFRLFWASLVTESFDPVQADVGCPPRVKSSFSHSQLLLRLLRFHR